MPYSAAQTPALPAVVACLERVLQHPLPGLPTQMGMAPQPRPGTERILDPALDCRRAGVLVLLYPCPAPSLTDSPLGAGETGRTVHDQMATDLCVVLTRRTDSVDNHRGQISFPGGSLDPGEDAEAAALREGWEELAIDPARLRVIGRLSPLYIPPSGFRIDPVVAYGPGRPDFAPNAMEVAEVLEVPLAHLLDPDTRGVETWSIRGQAVRVPFYAVGHHKVWGATAMVLCELLSLLQTATEVDADGAEGVIPGAAGRGQRIATAHDPRF